jgi:glycosyltransferase involved in cell wall biosynthesis
VFPSRYTHEAEPLVLDEALAAGASLVATRRGCISPSTYRGPSVRITESDSIAIVAEAIQELMRSTDTPVASRNLFRCRRDASSVQLQQALTTLSKPVWAHRVSL